MELKYLAEEVIGSLGIVRYKSNDGSFAGLNQRLDSFGCWFEHLYTKDPRGL